MNFPDILQPTISRTIAIIIATSVIALASYIWNKRKKAKEEKLNSAIIDLDEIQKFKNEFRHNLTKLISIYYKNKYKLKNIKSVFPNDNISVLANKNYIPDKPIKLKEIEQGLIWEEKIPDIKKNNKISLVEVLKKSSPNKTLYNGYIYKLIETDGKVFKFTKGKYFDFLNTCEYLSYELASFFVKNSFYKNLLLKDNESGYKQITDFLINNPDSIPQISITQPFNFLSRHSAFGTCSIVILKRTNKESVFILNVRSSQLTETPNLVHVIPAGTFQPNTQNNSFHKKEFLFSENIFREFIEELVEDIHIRQNPKFVTVYEDMYGKGKGKKFRDRIIRPENFELLYLGTVIDPLNLKPEILTVLLLHEGHIGELLSTNPSWETEGTSLRQIEFKKEKLKEIIEKENLVPTGKAHLTLALHHFDLIKERLNHI